MRPSISQSFPSQPLSRLPFLFVLAFLVIVFSAGTAHASWHAHNQQNPDAAVDFRIIWTAFGCAGTHSCGGTNFGAVCAHKSLNADDSETSYNFPSDKSDKAMYVCDPNGAVNVNTLQFDKSPVYVCGTSDGHPVAGHDDCPNWPYD